MVTIAKQRGSVDPSIVQNNYCLGHNCQNSINYHQIKNVDVTNKQAGPKNVLRPFLIVCISCEQQDNNNNNNGRNGSCLTWLATSKKKGADGL